ncbi:uncharacterized protein METZ01_LOCUS304362, partial [marine metagenome]
FSMKSHTMTGSLSKSLISSVQPY